MDRVEHYARIRKGAIARYEETVRLVTELVGDDWVTVEDIMACTGLKEGYTRQIIKKLVTDGHLQPSPRIGKNKVMFRKVPTDPLHKRGFIHSILHEDPLAVQPEKVVIQRDPLVALLFSRPQPEQLLEAA